MWAAGNIITGGLITGAIYALLAVGYSLVFSVSGALNLAQGAFVALGALTMYTFSHNAHLSLPLAFLASLVVVTAAIGLIEWVVIRPAVTRISHAHLLMMMGGLITMLVIGGMGTLFGPLIGVALLTYLPLASQSIASYSMLLTGVLLVLFLRYLPAGIWGGVLEVVTRARARVTPGRTGAGTAAVPAASASVPVPFPESPPGLPGSSPGPASPPASSGDPPGTDGTAALDVRGLTKSFGGVGAVRNVSFTVPKGSLTALIGPNGAGKSTVFNLVTNLYRPDSGEVYLEGRSITNVPPNRITSLGLFRTFQTARVFPQLTVLDNVLVGGYRLGRAGYAAQALRLPRCRREEQEAADDGHRPGPDVGPALPAARRAVARAGPAGHPAHLRRHRAAARRGQGHPAGRAERAARPGGGRARVPARTRHHHADRHRQGTAGQRRSGRALPRGGHGAGRGQPPAGLDPRPAPRPGHALVGPAPVTHWAAPGRAGRAMIGVAFPQHLRKTDADQADHRRCGVGRVTGVMVKTVCVEFFCYHRDRAGSATLREDLLEEHWTYMDRYHAEMIARGPTLDGDGDGDTATGSVHIVDLPDPAAARAFAFDEPNYQAGVYRDVLLRRWRNMLARTMWDFPGGQTGGNRYLVLGLGAGPAADLDVPPGRDELIAYGPLLSDDGATWLGTAALIRARTPEAARGILTPDRYADMEVHSWQFGGRPS